MHGSMKLFAFALCAVLTGCTEITFITNEAPGLPPVSTDDASAAADAGVMATADAGVPGSDAGMVEFDAGASEVDAGTDTTVLVATFNPSGGLLYHDSAGWQRLGGVEFAAHGSDVTINRVRVGGRSVRLVSGYTLAREGVIIGNDAPPHSVGDFADILLGEPLQVRDGERITVDVWGRVPGTVLNGELTVNLYEIEAFRSDGGVGLEIVRAGLDSRFRVWRNYPVIVPQPLFTTTLTNGVTDELYRFLVTPIAGSGTVYIGSLTFRFAGLGSGRSLRYFRVVRDSTALDPSTYHVLQTGTFTDLDSAPLDTPSAQITIVFPGDLPISGPGDIFTLSAITSGFESGDTLDVFFGDWIFSGTIARFWGHLTSEGAIDEFDGIGHTVSIDPVVWSDGNPDALYTGLDDLGSLAGLLTDRALTAPSPADPSDLSIRRTDPTPFTRRRISSWSRDTFVAGRRWR